MASLLGCFVISDKFLEILDQIVELSDLNIVLNDVAWVQKVDGLHILLDCLIILLLLEQFVSMLFDDLTLDILWKACFSCNSKCFSVMRLFH